MPSRRSFQLVLFSLLVMSSPTSSASFSSTSAFERLPICSTHRDCSADCIDPSSGLAKDYYEGHHMVHQTVQGGSHLKCCIIIVRN